MFDQDPDQCLVIQAGRQSACSQLGWPFVKTVSSVLAHIGLVVGVGLSAWYRRQYTSSTLPDFSSYSLVSGLVAVLFYAVILVEASVCDTYRALRLYHAGQTAEQYIDTARDARPLIR